MHNGTEGQDALLSLHCSCVIHVLGHIKDWPGNPLFIQSGFPFFANHCFPPLST